MSIIRAPQTSAEWARDTEKRLRALENLRTLRVGGWVLTEVDGQIVATRPSGVLDVGQEPLEPVVADLTRGYVTPDEVEQAVTGTTPAKAGALASLASFVTGKWTDLLDSINGAAGAWAGVPGSTGYTPAQAAAEQADAQATLAANAAAIAALQAQSTGGSNSGVYALVDFSTYPDSTSPPSVLTTTYTGSGGWTWQIVSGRLVPVGFPSDLTRRATAIYNVTATDSPYQRVGVAFSSAPAVWISGSKSRNGIIVRSNLAGTSYVYVEFTADSWEMGCVVSGVRTVWTTNSGTFKFKATAAYWLEPGTLGSARVYRLYENTTLLKQYPEVGTASIIAADHQHVGIYAENGSYSYPGNILALAFADNTPPAVVGSGFKVARTSTGSAVSLSSGVNLFPGGWFDTPVLNTSDITYDPATNKATVTVSGHYRFTLSTLGNAGGPGSGGSVGPAVFKNGLAESKTTPTFTSNTSQFNGIHGSFDLYLAAGDSVQPGYAATTTLSAASMVGDSSGLGTFWSLTLLNTSYK